MTPWLHRWAVFTVGATLLLLALGSIVTTLRVGMADPIWPTYPWHLLLISWREPSAGFLIEHTHRLAGYIVGCCVIGLTVGLWIWEERRWVRWLGTTALLAVIVQGLLGGFRVKLNALMGTDLAAIHGCFAQLVFALLTSLAVFTSRTWKEPGLLRGTASANEGLRRAALLTALWVYLQIVFGAVVRHTYSPLGQRAHFLFAFAVVASVVWLARLVFVERVGPQRLSSVLGVMLVLLVLQLLLGVETWFSRFGAGVFPDVQQPTLRQGLLRTAHFLVGSLLFATTVTAALLAQRGKPLTAVLPQVERDVEGAA